MFVRRSRFDAVTEQLELVRAELDRTRFALHALHGEKALLAQARDFHKRDAEEWKGRAQRLIDTIGINSGTLSAPVMGDPSEPHTSTRRIMTALGRQEKASHKADPPPSSSAEILGVDDAAAQAAVAAVLQSH